MPTCSTIRNLTVTGDVAFTLVDREGLLRISEMILVEGGSVPALMFLKTLAVLMFGTDSDIGLDPNYDADAATGKVMAITVEQKRFEVEKMIYSHRSLVGRGTRVWIVKYNGDRLVL